MTAIATEVVTPQADLKATLRQDLLLEAIKFAAASLCSRPPMRVLQGLLIEADGTSVKVTGFDYEQCTSQVVDGAGSGSALVPGRLLQDLVASFDKGALLELFVEETKVIIESAGTRFAVPTLPIEDYPALPAITGTRLVTIPGAQLTEWAKVAVAAGRDATLPVLTGVRLDTDSGELEVVATDRYRLARFLTGLKVSAKIKQGALVPAGTVTFVAKQFAKELLVDVLVTYGDSGRVTFRAGGRTASIRTMDGEFPRYRSLLPSEFDSCVTFDSKELSTAIKRAALVAARNAPVQLGVRDDQVVIEAGNGDDAHAVVDVNATVSGGAGVDGGFTIAFNPGYALDSVAVAGGKQVVVKFVTPTRPMLWADPECPSFEVLLMPVRLSG